MKIKAHGADPSVGLSLKILENSMAEITATLVNQLRSRTNLGMMECKKLLTEAGGDLDKAIDIARKKGVKASLAEREAREGRVLGAVSSNGRNAAVVEINCNTDFTARSEPVHALGLQAARALAEDPSGNVASAVAAEITAAAQTTGENVRLGKSGVVTASGRAAVYTYAISGKIAVALAFSGNPSDELVTDIGGHIAFSRPLALDRSGIDPAVVAKEKEIAVEQAKATGKPQQIAEKIAEGKLDAFFKERSLLDQDFYNGQKFKGSIQQMLKQQGVMLEKYLRVEVGEA